MGGQVWLRSCCAFPLLQLLCFMLRWGSCERLAAVRLVHPDRLPRQQQSSKADVTLLPRPQRRPKPPPPHLGPSGPSARARPSVLNPACNPELTLRWKLPGSRRTTSRAAGMCQATAGAGPSTQVSRQGTPCGGHAARAARCSRLCLVQRLLAPLPCSLARSPACCLSLTRVCTSRLAPVSAAAPVARQPRPPCSAATPALRTRTGADVGAAQSRPASRRPGPSTHPRTPTPWGLSCRCVCCA